MKRTFNVIAISGSCIHNLTNRLVSREDLRRYLKPETTALEVDEEANKVSYNGHTYDFVEYRSGIHGFARIVAFNVNGVVIEAYTDTPAQSNRTREDILAALKDRREDPRSGY